MSRTELLDGLGSGPAAGNGSRLTTSRGEGAGLPDLLERILDKGIVIAGDIAINLVDIELLTIKIRLLIASADKAKELGIDWWESDGWLSSRGGGRSELEALGDRVAELEAQLEDRR
jgi:hypothetical protein